MKLLLSGIAGGILAAAVVVALQLAVDPYDFFGNPGIVGINALKPFMYENSRLAKPPIIAHEKPSAIIFGGSTSESAYDPDSVYFRPYGRTYNAALPGGRFYESYRMLQHSSEVSNLKLAVVALDFANWIGMREIKTVNFPDNHLAISYGGKRQSPLSWLTVLNPRRITNGLVTLSYQDERVLMNGTNSKRFPSQWYRSNGQRTHGSSQRYGIAYRGYDGPFRSLMRRQYGRLRVIDPALPFPARVHGKSYFALIDQFAELSKQKNIKLVLNLPPCHVSILDTFYEAGAWRYLEEFKKKIADRVRDDNNRLGTDIAVYDFCVVSTETDAPVFDRPDRMTPVRGFWDAGHPSNDLGEVALGIMLGGKKPIGQFGTDLAQVTNMNSYLATQRRALEAVRRSMPKEFQIYTNIFKGPPIAWSDEAN